MIIAPEPWNGTGVLRAHAKYDMTPPHGLSRPVPYVDLQRLHQVGRPKPAG
jgi:hypothetical protein